MEVREGLAQDLLQERVLELREPFDLIHLDGSMKCYEDFLERILASDLLTKSGVALADNVLFRGLVRQAGGTGRLKRIARSLHDFNVKFMQEDPRSVAFFASLSARFWIAFVCFCLGSL